MVYLIYGSESIRIKGNISKIVSEKLGQTDEFNFVRFDGSNVLLQDVIEECNYLPLGYERKVVSLEDCYFLLKPKPRNPLETDQDYKAFMEYLSSPNEATDLILSVCKDEEHSLDEKSAIFLSVKEKGKIISIVDPSPADWSQYVRLYLDKLGVRIDNDAIKELADRTYGDVALFRNSALKLSLYTDKITYEDVCLMVTRRLEDNAFDIFNNLINKKNKQALSIYRDLKVDNVEPITLIGMLANQFLMLNQVIYLAKQGYSDDDGAKQLGIKPIRFKILRRNTFTVSQKAIEKALEDLFNLDYQIKSGQVDRFYAFELFLINFKTN